MNCKDVYWLCTKCCCFRFLVILNWVNLKLCNVKLLNLRSVCILGYLDFVNGLLFQTKNKLMKWICFHHLGHIEIYFQSVTHWPMQAGTSPRESRNKSNIWNSVLCSEYKIIDRVQKWNNAKYQGSHSTSSVRVAKAFCIWMSRNL